MATSQLAFMGKLEKADILKHATEAVKDLVKNINIDFDEHGVQVQCTDVSSVGLVHLNIRESVFTEFHCPKPITVGINAESLFRMLKMCGTEDQVTIKKKPNENELIFEFISGDEDQRPSSFRMKTLEVEQEDLSVAEKEHEAVVTMQSKMFKNYMKDLKDIGDVCSFVVDDEGFKLEVSGEVGKTTVIMAPGKEDDPKATKIQRGETAVSGLSFGLRYLNLFTRASALSETCKISMTTGEPMELRYPLGDKSHGYLRFLLAPKLDEEN